MTPGVITLAGTVKKLIDRFVVNEPPQAQIFLAGADHLYCEFPMFMHGKLANPAK